MYAICLKIKEFIINIFMLTNVLNENTLVAYSLIANLGSVYFMFYKNKIDNF